jgi:1-aminocyclopropane-1-carboxylate deaminase/D-cysteine desulfhydrase-like pyridoxal-dependent ACC family enzyme
MKYLNILFLIFCIMRIFPDDCSLFRKFPKLKGNLAYKSFCDLPTPITKLENFGRIFGHNNIYLKRDDLTGSLLKKRLYGGNKARKLEWLLADALEKNATKIMTYGCAGSNHALATAIYSNLLGLSSILMLKPQPTTNIVRQNLILDFYSNADIRFFKNNKDRDEARNKILQDKSIYFIPTGGSNKIGAIGFVNAAFELVEQIKNGVINLPDYIYLPIGSSGTTAGLMLGFSLQKLPTKIIAIAVEPEEHENQFRDSVKKLFKETNEFLNSLDNSIELIEFPNNQLTINNTIATEYGEWNNADFDTIKLFKDLENITIEGTYSTKPIIALINDIKNNLLVNKTVLVWETYCGLDFNHKINSFDFKVLPKFCHPYFTNQ